MQFLSQVPKALLQRIKAGFSEILVIVTVPKTAPAAAKQATATTAQPA